MRLVAPLLVLLVCSTLTNRPPARAQELPALPCGDIGRAETRTTLYFGLDSKMGAISEAQWKTFLAREVTPRFPNGFTVWQADGQWRRADGIIVRERSKVLLLVHEDAPAVRAKLTAVIESYKHAYAQESVLWETARVCAAF